jgi:hypothetical protein
VNIKIYKTATLLVVLCGSETWSFTLKKDQRMKVVIKGCWKEHRDVRDSKELGD